jgi:hypothetical protein
VGKSHIARSAKQKAKQWQLDGAKALQGDQLGNSHDLKKVREEDALRLCAVLEEYKVCLSHSSIALTINASMTEFLESHTSTDKNTKALLSFSQFIALGIGSISQSVNSQWQFALFLCLGGFQKRSDDEAPVQLTCFDPSMNSMDISICNHFGIRVLTENQKGLLSQESFSVTNERTLIYMPHCPYRLYCNVLWSFWNKLTQMLLIGNSFQSYAMRRSLAVSDDARVRSHERRNKRSNKNIADSLPSTDNSINRDEITDPTDSVAMLTPLLRETLLPLTLHAGQEGHFSHRPESLSSMNDNLSSQQLYIIPRHIAEAAFCELRYTRYTMSFI